jgi:hypothetical protein
MFISSSSHQQCMLWIMIIVLIRYTHGLAYSYRNKWHKIGSIAGQYINGGPVYI